MKFNIEEQYKNKSGIYRIRNLINGKVYIGQTINFYQRYLDHYKELKGNYHCNEYLQNSVNKYGINNFVFEFFEYIEINQQLLNFAEQKYLDFYLNENKQIDKNKCYNICPI